jgi:hypothetical protein
MKRTKPVDINAAPKGATRIPKHPHLFYPTLKLFLAIYLSLFFNF